MQQLNCVIKSGSINFTQGDSWLTTIELRLKNLQTSVENPYPIDPDSLITFSMPGTPTVVLSTANAGQVVISSATASTIVLNGPAGTSIPEGSGNITAKLGQNATMVITSPDGLDVKTVEFKGVLNVAARLVT